MTARISAKRNILFIYLSTFFGNGYFERAIFMLYLLDQGYTLLQVGLLQSLLNLSMFLFEIPTGMFADRFGRKTSLIVGRLLIMAYFAGMVYADNFYIVAASFIVMGIGVTFLSGTEEALLFDSAKHLGREQDFTRIAGRYSALITLVLAIAMGAGGYLKEISWSAVFVVSIVFQLIAVFFTFFIKEIEIKKSNEGEKRSFTYFVKDTADFLRMNRAARALIIGSAVFSGVISIYLLFVQQILSQLGYEVYLISTISAVVTLLCVVVSDKAHLLEKRFSSRTVLKASVWLAGLFFLAIYPEIPIVSVVAFLVIKLCLYLFSPVSYTLVNIEIPSEQRATLLSVMSFVSSLIMFVLSPIIGYVSEAFGTQKFLAIAGALSMVVVWVCIRYFFTGKQVEGQVEVTG